MRAEGECLELWWLWARVDARDERADADLVARLRRGDPSAFEQVVRQHQQRVYNLAFRMLRRHEDAEDVTQEAFLKAFEALPRFRGEAAVGTWVCRIAANLCVSWLRSKARRGEVTTDPTAIQDHQKDVADPAAGELARAARAAVAQLPAKYRLAVTAYYLEGRSYEESARVVGVRVRALKTQLHRARKMLREMVRDAPFRAGEVEP